MVLVCIFLSYIFYISLVYVISLILNFCISDILVLVLVSDISLANIRAALGGWSVGWLTGLGCDIVGLMRPSS